MDRLLDLRFVIGLFFLIVGILLLVYGFLIVNSKEYLMINALCGMVFTIFGSIMIWLSRNKGD